MRSDRAAEETLLAMATAKMTTRMTMMTMTVSYRVIRTFCFVFLTLTFFHAAAADDDEADEDDQQIPRNQEPPRNKENHAAAPPDRNRQERSVKDLFQGLYLAAGDEDMLHHLYDWHEGVITVDINTGTKIRMHHLTCNVLLPGPTTSAQLACMIPAEDTTSQTLKMEYKPPSTYISAERTAVRAVNIAGIPRAGFAAAVPQTRTSSRVQGHQDALTGGVLAAQSTITKLIHLPFPVDSRFCRRDDCGRDNAMPIL
jgi:hypothetical protein